MVQLYLVKSWKYFTV